MIVPKTKRERLVKKVIKYIRHCKMKTLAEITVNELANKTGTTPANLSRAFKRETSETLQHFLIKEKMNRCFTWIMHHPEFTIKEVAEMAGYNSTSQFTITFEKIAKVSPGELRQRFLRRIPQKSYKSVSKI